VTQDEDSVTTNPKAFGPSALATPANAVTAARLAAAPIFAVIIAEVTRPTWTLFGVWCVLALSDGADGWLARWHGTTRSGAFLDPLADKFLVLGALAALADRGIILWPAVAVIALRELAMSVFRIRVGKAGVSVPARPSAKLKTVVQDFLIGFALSPLIMNGHGNIVTVTLWLAVALTITSGLSYWRDARRKDVVGLSPKSLLTSQNGSR
jgi:CDP-diacylglycerol--glycerol-3-phosphate 3-phosphatidyltransferase